MNQGDLEVNLLGVKLKYRSYLMLQILVVLVLLISGLGLRTLADSENRLLSNAWWICLAWMGVEIIEAMIVTRLAKRNHLKKDSNRKNPEGPSQP